MVKKEFNLDEEDYDFKVHFERAFAKSLGSRLSANLKQPGSFAGLLQKSSEASSKFAGSIFKQKRKRPHTQ